MLLVGQKDAEGSINASAWYVGLRNRGPDWIEYFNDNGTENKSWSGIFQKPSWEVLGGSKDQPSTRYTIIPVFSHEASCGPLCILCWFNLWIKHFTIVPGVEIWNTNRYRLLKHVTNLRRLSGILQHPKVFSGQFGPSFTIGLWYYWVRTYEVLWTWCWKTLGFQIWKPITPVAQPVSKN